MLSVTRICARRIPRTLNVFVARRNTSSFREGSVAQSREFGKKEKAHEDEYVRRHEQEALKKLREEIERKEKELAELKKQHETVAAKE